MIKNTKLLRFILVVLPVVAGAWGLRTSPALRNGMTPHDGTRPGEKELRCFSIIFRFPFYDKQGNKIAGGELMNHDNRVFLYKDLVMFELPYGYASGSDGMAPDTSETRYSYFVFHRDSSKGVEYDLHKPGQVEHRYVDSVRLFTGGFKDDGKAGFFDRASARLLYRKRDLVNGNLTEIYSLRDSAYPGTATDSLWLSYSDRYGILPSNLLTAHDKDSLPKMRLIRLHAKLACRDMPAQNGIVLDHAEMSWKIEETPFFNRDSAMIYFNKYQGYCDSAGAGPSGH